MADASTKKTQIETLQKELKENSSFVSETSLHGVKYITARNRGPVARCLWLLIVIACSAWLVYTLYTLYNRYISYPHTTTFTIVKKDTLPVPAFSLCLPQPLRREALKKPGFPSPQEIHDILFTSWYPNFWFNVSRHAPYKNVTVRQVMETGSFGVEEIILYAEVTNGLMLRHQDFSVWDFPIGLGFTPVRCFVYNATDSEGHRKQMRVFDSLGMVLRISQEDLLTFDDVGGIYIAFHQPWESPFFGKIISMQRGSAVTIQIRQTMNRFLPDPYRSQNNNDCMESEYTSLRFDPDIPPYSIGNCIQLKAMATTASLCNCTSVRLVFEIEKMLDECPVQCQEDVQEISWGTVFPFPAPEAVPVLISMGRITNKTDIRELLKVSLKYESSLVRVNEHVPELTFDKLYGTVGGQMGLFLGASLVTMTELAEFLLCLLWSLIRRVFNRQTRTTTDSETNADFKY